MELWYLSKQNCPSKNIYPQNGNYWATFNFHVSNWVTAYCGRLYVWCVCLCDKWAHRQWEGLGPLNQTDMKTNPNSSPRVSFQQTDLAEQKMPRSLGYPVNRGSGNQSSYFLILLFTSHPSFRCVEACDAHFQLKGSLVARCFWLLTCLSRRCHSL